MTGCCATEVIYDLQETRRWLVDGHALTDLDGTGDRLSGRWRRDDDWTSELSARSGRGWTNGRISTEQTVSRMAHEHKKLNAMRFLENPGRRLRDLHL